MILHLQFCEKCRKLVKSVEDLHFIEENSDRGFCSEKCILEFYRPFMQAFEEEENSIRASLNLVQESESLEIMGNEHFLQTALDRPHEIWLAENEVGQAFYTHILELDMDAKGQYFILICAYIEGAPSFVYYRTITADERLLNHFRRDHLLEQEQLDALKEQHVLEQEGIPPEVIEEVELKKSELLAQMMQVRSIGDIELEEFPNYDSYLEKTLSLPDEIYEFDDDAGDTIHCFLKSFKLGETSFFYVVLAMIYQESGQNKTFYIPILGFPSVDEKLYGNYAQGKKLNQGFKN